MTVDATLLGAMPPSVDDLLAAARATLPPRPDPAGLAEALERGALVVDIRPIEQRARDGEIPGSVVIARNVLEWRLDPSSEHRIPEASYEREIVIVCDGGYASSLAAATLQQLGLARATDLDGGVQAWIESGRPRRYPDEASSTARISSP